MKWILIIGMSLGFSQKQKGIWFEFDSDDSVIEICNYSKVETKLVSDMKLFKYESEKTKELFKNIVYGNINVEDFFYQRYLSVIFNNPELCKRIKNTDINGFNLVKEIENDT